MTRKLISSQILYILFVTVCSFLVITTFTANKLTEVIIDHEAKALYREAYLIANDYGNSYYGRDITLDEFSEKLSAIDTYLNADIWIVEPNGTILIDSNHPEGCDESAIIDSFSISDFEGHYYIIGDFYGTMPENSITVYSPINYKYKIRSYVLIHKQSSELTSKLNEYILPSYQSLMIILGIVTFFSFILWISTFRPVRRLSKVAKEYANGNYDAKLTVAEANEIGDLAASIKYMAHELQTLEDDQKKFISNVSHDFRSPLTSIKGYVEAIKDGTIPVEMQGKYLDIILYETERLQKLTEGLLELNKYGRKGSYLNISEFDINSLIKTTCLTFEGRCKQKNINFELILTGDKTMVLADQSKIQQVVHNLVDNALKFSNTDSTITIETTIKNEKAFISVKDRGIGIPEASQNKIWERFYKTDLSRGKDKKGTGLGLAIVKEIVQAHKENINVISTEGIGSEFIFSLPLSKNNDEE